MDVIQNLGKEKDDVRLSIVENTRRVALESLEREYEKAKVSIEETSDLRILRSMVTRIGTLNNPRGRVKK